MKKFSKLLCLVLAMCMVFSMMAACGATKTEEPKKEETKTEEPKKEETKKEEPKEEDKKEESAAPAVGKTDIVFANASDIASIDPHKVSDNTSITMLKHVYCTLLDLDNEGNLIPDLAESYKWTSDTEVVFKLNEKAIFADGTPITANDVKFSLERAKDMAKVKSLVVKLDSVTVDNDHQVTVKLTEPYAVFIYMLANSRLSILSEAAVTAAGDAYGDVDNVVASGAYSMAEWAANDHYTLKRNDNYWGEMPVTTSITCRVVPEGNARAIMLETGEVDLVYSVDATTISSLEGNPDIELVQGLASSVEVIGFNLENEALQDERVRQAISMAINKDEIIAVVQQGNAIAANSILNKTIPGWSEDVKDLPYDVEKAKELMKDAGYYDQGITISHYFFNATRNRIAQMIQAMLAEINVTVDICAVEGSALFDCLGNGDHDTYDISSGNTNFNADTTFYNMFHSDNIGSSNYIGLNDPEMDERIESIARIIDDAERNAAYKELQQDIMDTAYVVPLYYQISTVGINSELKGFEIAASGCYDLCNLYYEK